MKKIVFFLLAVFATLSMFSDGRLCGSGCDKQQE